MALTVNDVLGFGTKVTIPGTDTLVNAGTMTLTVTHPDGTAYAGSPFTITPTSTGIYDKDIPSTMAGRYVGKWVATGANSGAHTQVFHVRSGDETAIVSLDEVKDHLNIPQATTTHDQELERKIGTATTVVEYFCGPVARRTETKEVRGGSSVIYLPHSQVLSLTSLTPIMTSAPTVTIADLAVSTEKGKLYHKSELPISWGPLTAAYVVGRVAIPDALVEAALIIIKHLWETQRGPGGGPTVLGSQSSARSTSGETTFLPVMGFAIPNRAMDLLNLHPDPAGIQFGVA